MEIPPIFGTPSDPNGDPFAKVRSAVPWAFKGAALVGVASVILISVGIWYGGNYVMKNVFDIDMDPTVEPPGDIRAFDPIATYAAVKAYAGEGAQLTGVSATYVRTDGTLDLMAELTPTPFVTYEFVREIAAGPDAPPVGAGGNESGTQWQTVSVRVGSPGQRSYVKKTSGASSQQYFYDNRGMKKDEGSPQGSNYKTVLPDPTCSFADLWSKAKEHGAPKEAVAVIDYDKGGYDFTIRDTEFRMEFGTDCVAKTLKGKKL